MSRKPAYNVSASILVLVTIIVHCIITVCVTHLARDSFDSYVKLSKQKKANLWTARSDLATDAKCYKE